MFGAVFFLLGLIVSWISAGEVPGSIHLQGGALTAGIAFVASLLLMLRDGSDQSVRYRNVRRRLLPREDVEDQELVASVDPADRELTIEMRRRLAQWFGVPATKIRLHDDLEILAFNDFIPMIYLAVMSDFCQRHQISRIGRFPKTTLKTVADLVSEAKTLLAFASESDGRLAE